MAVAAGGVGGAGGAGTAGGAGGKGGKGGDGGAGGVGGGGGGAVEIVARGQVVAQGAFSAQGAAPGAGAGGAAGLFGEQGVYVEGINYGGPGATAAGAVTIGGRTYGYGGRTPENAATSGDDGYSNYQERGWGGGGGGGGDGAATPRYQGSSTMIGAFGGTGGRGGTGGSGGAGGGGGGGTVSLIGSVVNLSGASFNVGDGVGTASGKLIAGANTAGFIGVTGVGAAANVTTAGSRRTNPFLTGGLSGVDTPAIPGVTGGAEAFGIVPGVSALTNSYFSSVRANAPAGAALAAVAVDKIAPGALGFTGLEADYAGFDVIFVMNLTAGIVDAPKFALSDSAGGNFAPVQLRLGGWSYDAAFGGSGIQPALASFNAGQVYALLVPEGMTRAAALGDALPGYSSTANLSNGSTLYAIPEPAGAALLACGGALLGLRRRRRG